MKLFWKQKKSLAEGGIPIGAVLVKDGEIISRGHNRLIQNDSVVLHAEMDAIENAGRLDYEDYRKCNLYTTLSPCPMCSGAVILYNIPRVVIGENTTLGVRRIYCAAMMLKWLYSITSNAVICFEIHFQQF